MHQSPSREKSGGAHINPTAPQITWIAFCPVTPTTQTADKKRSQAAQGKSRCIKVMCMQQI